MRKSEIERLPHFESLDALVEFFDTHDWGDYLDELPEVEFEVDIKRKAILVALDAPLADKLAEIAESKQTSPEALASAWVREKILEQA